MSEKMNERDHLVGGEVLYEKHSQGVEVQASGRILVSSWEEGFDLQPPDYKPNALTIRSYCPKVHSWFSVFAFVVVIMGYLKEVKKDKEADRYSEMKDGQRDPHNSFSRGCMA